MSKLLSKLSSILRKYFITGLLVIIPMWGTYLILKTLFTSLDGVLGGFLQRQFHFYIPGFGVISLFFLILLTGLFVANIFGRKLVRMWEEFLQQVPVVRNVYSTVKAVVDTFSNQNKEKLSRVVLVEFPRKGCFTLGFVTGHPNEEISSIAGEPLINVYVPTTPNPTGGYMVLFPEREVKSLSMTVEEGMKMILSTGAVNPPSRKSKIDGPAESLLIGKSG
ncbi:MAG: DUF502 domain-containing protein [Nitrospirae bacterium]|nr:DUF502 domain-containing protein [Nitrospirota bacterium]